MSDVVILGAGGVLAPFLAEQLTARGHSGVCYSRRAPLPARGNFVIRNFSNIRSDFPTNAVVISPLWIGALAELLPGLPRPRHIIAFSSGQINSQHDKEALEASVCTYCQRAGVTWTILRPAMVYCPPIDRTVTALARLIRKLRFFPYWGRMNGLRQPLHAEDLAIAAAQAMVSDAAKDLAFDLPGGETLSFRDMVSRIFRALDLPPIMVPIPRFALNIAIKPYVKARPSVIGDTSLGVVDRVIALMNTNMVLDVEPARMAFGFCPRPFAPVFPTSF